MLVCSVVTFAEAYAERNMATKGNVEVIGHPVQKEVEAVQLLLLLLAAAEGPPAGSNSQQQQQQQQQEGATVSQPQLQLWQQVLGLPLELLPTAVAGLQFRRTWLSDDFCSLMSNVIASMHWFVEEHHLDQVQDTGSSSRGSSSSWGCSVDATTACEPAAVHDIPAEQLEWLELTRHLPGPLLQISYRCILGTLQSSSQQPPGSSSSSSTVSREARAAVLVKASSGMADVLFARIMGCWCELDKQDRSCCPANKNSPTAAGNSAWSRSTAGPALPVQQLIVTMLQLLQQLRQAAAGAPPNGMAARQAQYEIGSSSSSKTSAEAAAAAGVMLHSEDDAAFYAYESLMTSLLVKLTRVPTMHSADDYVMQAWKATAKAVTAEVELYLRAAAAATAATAAAAAQAAAVAMTQKLGNLGYTTEL
jgi:hypothetical protein